MNNKHFDFIYNNIKINPVDHNGSIWFFANEICAVLGYVNPRMIVARHVKPIDKDVTNCYTLGGPQQMTIISENGVYDLVFASHMPNAEAFKDYIKKIITSVRQIGYYAEPEVMQQFDANPESVRDLNTQVREIIKNTKPQMYFLVGSDRYIARDREEKNQMITAMMPLANLGMAAMASNQCVSINELAKLIHNITNEDCGLVNSLYTLLRRDGFLMKNSSNKNIPTARLICQGLMMYAFDQMSGNYATVVTPYGIEYFINLYVFHTESVQPSEQIPVIETVDK